MGTEEQSKPPEIKQISRQISIPIDMNLIYVNGGNIGLSPTEVQFTATTNGRPHALILFPFPVAKSIATAMLKAIGDYETKTGVTIPELNELALKLKI